MTKKITFSLLVVLGCMSAFAAYADEATPPTQSNSDVNLAAPSQKGSWSLGLQMNYLQPNTAFDYDVETIKLADGSSQSKTDTVNTDYSLGWSADVTYHFANTGRDLTWAYTHLSTNNSNSGTDTSARVKSDYNAADFLFGQVIALGDRFSVHPFVGLRYAGIDYRTRVQNNNVYAEGALIEAIAYENTESHFQGLGPRFGSDVAVNLGSGFSVQGTLGMSLLVGSLDPRLSLSTSMNTNQPDPTTKVVPETDAKLGAMYTIDFNSGYALGIEAGYQVSNYFGAVANSSSSITDTTTDYNNFFMQGPYARLQLDMA